MALFGFLRPDRGRLDALEQRLAALEAGEQAREVAFLDIAERVKRHLSRAAAIDQRTKSHAEQADPVTLAVLTSKFPPRERQG